MIRRMLLATTRIAVLVGLTAGSVTVGTASAQTPEGTVIADTATVSWTDANGNTYAPDSASVSITVGFSAGIDLIVASATATPATPSTDDTLTFRVANIGNGTDSIVVAESITGAGGVITVTGYRLNGGSTYGTLAALNADLSQTAIAMLDTLVIQVIYDVSAGAGGESVTYAMTVTSRRDNTASDNGSTVITPSESFAVDVTPTGGQNVEKLPSNGTMYSFTFTVTNNGTGTESFDLFGTSPGSAVITVESVGGLSGDSTRVSDLGAGLSQNIVVEYTVANVAAGTTDTLTLTARSVSDPGTTSAGFMDLTVVQPSLVIAKQAFRDDKATPIGGGEEVVPAEFIQYRVTVTNNGNAPAQSVQVVDALPPQVTYQSTSDPAGGWSISETAGTVTATLSQALEASGGTAFFWIRVKVD